MGRAKDMGASADADRAATPSGPSPAVSGVAGIPCADELPIIAALEGRPSELTLGELWAAAGIIRALYGALELAAEILGNMFENGAAYTPVDGEECPYGAYYIGSGVMPAIGAALAKARGQQ